MCTLSQKHQARRFLTLSHREARRCALFPQGGPQVCTLSTGRPASVHSFTGRPASVHSFHREARRCALFPQGARRCALFHKSTKPDASSPFPTGGPQVCTLPAGRPAGVHSFTGSPQVCLSHKSWTASSSSLPVYPKSLWKLAFNSRHFVLNNHGRNCTTHRSAGRGNFLRGKPSWDFLFTKPPAPTAPGCIVPHPTEDHFQT